MNITVIPVGTLGTNCYLLASKEGNCAVIDPGAQPDKIEDAIRQKGLTPRYILLTHGHHDHIGGVKKLMTAFEPVLAIGARDMELLTDSRKSLAAAKYNKLDDFMLENARALEDGEELELDELLIRILETPGHTKGGVVYLCEDVIFSGDTLFAGDVGRCDLYGGDYPTMKRSLARLRDLVGDYRVFPGHGPSTTLEEERKNNPYVNGRAE